MRRPARELRQDRSSGIPCSANPNNRLSRCAFPRSCVTTWSAPEKYSPATTRSPYPRRRFANCCWNLPSTTTWTIAWKWPIYGCAPRGLADHPAQMEAAPGSVARGMDLSGPMRTDRLRGAGPGPGTAAPGILRAGAGGLPGGAPLAPGGQGGVGPLLLGKSGVAGRASLRQGQLDGDVVPQIVAALVRQLRESPVPLKPVFAGRTLHVALREERVDGIASLNQSLCPICRCSIARPRGPSLVAFEIVTKSWPHSRVGPYSIAILTH